MKRNFKFRNSAGFTLMELVVVMVVMMIIGTLIVGILASTIRGTAKTKITNDLAQNGNYALSVITDISLNSQNFVSITDLSSAVHTVCDPKGTTGLSYSVEGFDGGVTTFACNDALGTISSNSASFSIPLLDSTRVKLVPNTTDSCLFTCTQADPYSPPRIDVTFKLMNANYTSTDSQGTATFNTSFTLRNISLK